MTSSFLDKHLFLINGFMVPYTYIYLLIFQKDEPKVDHKSVMERSVEIADVPVTRIGGTVKKSST